MASNFPTSYDDNTSLFGDLEDIIKLTLDPAAHPGGIDNTITALVFTETDLVDRLNLETELTFETEDGSGNIEIVRITAKGAAGSGEVTVTRGAHGTTAQSHAESALATQDPIAEHFKRLRDALVAAEKFKGKVGTTLPLTCDPGEMFIKTDTNEWYVCFTTDTWTLVNRPDHGEYANLASDDHAQYHTEARKVTWHDALPGDHLTNPTTHDHSGGAGLGNPIEKFRTGLDANRPAASQAGEVYYGYDNNNLYFSPDGTGWQQYTTMPTGTLFFFETSCPTGWTREGSLDGLFMRGAPTATWTGLSSGGALTHDHAMDDLIAHDHTVSGQTGSTGGAGNHNHQFSASGGSGGSTLPFNRTDVGVNNIVTSSAGGHSHTFTKPSNDTQSSGQASPRSGSGTSEPPYRTLVVCRKD